MKTSKKLIIGIALLLTLMTIVSLLLIRNRIQEKFADRINDPKFKKVALEDFQKIDISSDWNVTVTNGLYFKVEVSAVSNSELKVVNGTLFIAQDSVSGSERTIAKITTPNLRAIKALKNSNITIRDFVGDSLTVDIQDGCVFTGKDNKFKNMSFKSSGDARIEMGETPDL